MKCNGVSVGCKECMENAISEQKGRQLSQIKFGQSKEGGVLNLPLPSK